MLEVKGLQAAYGDVSVLWGLDLTLARGEIVSLIGANGAGKSSLLRCLSGLLIPTAGNICIGGRSFAGANPAAFVRSGVAHVPEGRRLFGAMSVRDNLVLGAYLRTDDSIASDMEYVFSLFPILKQRQHQMAGTLSGGEQQMCAIGRGILSRPQFLLIDELSLGLAPKIVSELIPILTEVASRDVGILLVEQDVATALDVASRGYVIERGRISASGASSALRQLPAISDAFFGAV